MKVKNIIYQLCDVMCSFAFLSAISSLDNMCIISSYQSKVPKSLEKYKK